MTVPRLLNARKVALSPSTNNPILAAGGDALLTTRMLADI